MDKQEVFARFTQSIEYLKDIGKARKHEEIAELMKRPRPHVSAAMRGDMRRFTEGFVKAFGKAYSDYINEEWLLTGEGEMTVPDKSMRPHIDAKASAGFMDGVSEGEYGKNLKPKIYPLPDYDFTIEANGRSMEPEIKNGDVLACRKAIDRLNPPIGKICVIDSKDGYAVKVITKTGDESFTLHSLNPDYADYELDLNDILGVAEVVGLSRRF